MSLVSEPYRKTVEAQYLTPLPVVRGPQDTIWTAATLLSA
jgi:hypothetical protein